MACIDTTISCDTHEKHEVLSIDVTPILVYYPDMSEMHQYRVRCPIDRTIITHTLHKSLVEQWGGLLMHGARLEIIAMPEDAGPPRRD